MNESYDQHPVNFLFVIGGGALFGLLVVLGLVFYYSPSTTFKAENVLLSPQVIEKLPLFDEVEFLFLNPSSKKWESKRLPLSVYGTFYKLIEGDVSVEPFDETSSARILIRAQKSEFQQIEFSDEGDSYRAQLKGQGEGPSWAYFSHEGILKKILSLFGAK